MGSSPTLTTMTYQEAYDLALKSKWINKPCFVGEECWCNIITTETPIIFGEDNDEVQIVSSGAINKQIAEHIVKVHNQSLELK